MKASSAAEHPTARQRLGAPPSPAAASQENDRPKDKPGAQWEIAGCHTRPRAHSARSGNPLPLLGLQTQTSKQIQAQQELHPKTEVERSAGFQTGFNFGFRLKAPYPLPLRPLAISLFDSFRTPFNPLSSLIPNFSPQQD